MDFGGVAAKYVRLTAKSNWSGTRPQFGLSEVRFFYVPASPRQPQPVSGAAGVDVDAILSWRAGREAASHKVYFGTDQQAVTDGTAPAGTVTDNSFDPGPLDSRHDLLLEGGGGQRGRDAQRLGRRRVELLHEAVHRRG